MVFFYVVIQKELGKIFLLFFVRLHSIYLISRVHISNITKNSSAAICGLRNGDRIIEVNGTNIQTLTYETILNKIKLHMERHDLELLVLDKKSLRWYRERKYPITSQTLPTIIHIEPILNNIDSGKQPSHTLDTQTKTCVFVGEFCFLMFLFRGFVIL